MKSIAILFFLAFLTGFQDAFHIEQPPSSISEPEQQSILEQLQGHLGKLSSQVTETINDGLGTMKGHLSDTVVYLAETGKKHIPAKIMNRKASHLVKDAQQYGQFLLNQGKEAVKDQFQKIAKAISDCQHYFPLKTLSEEFFQPAIKNCNKLVSLIGDQSLASISSTIQKNMKF